MMKGRNNPAKVSYHITVTYVEGYAPRSNGQLRTMRVAPIGQGIVSPSQSSAFGEREAPIVSSCTKATSTEGIANDIRTEASHGHSEARDTREGHQCSFPVPQTFDRNLLGGG